MMQFGFALASWGNLVSTFTVLLGWSEHESNLWNIGITTSTNLGTMVGALSAGAFVQYGKLKMIIALNLVLVASICVCMI